MTGKYGIIGIHTRQTKSGITEMRGETGIHAVQEEPGSRGLSCGDTPFPGFRQ